jgi:PAS domain-containing protein
MSSLERIEQRSAALIALADRLASVTDVAGVIELVSELPREIGDLQLQANIEELADGADASTSYVDVHDGRSKMAVPIDEHRVLIIRATLPRDLDTDLHVRAFLQSLRALIVAALAQQRMRDDQRLAELASALDVVLDMVVIERAIRDETGDVIDFEIVWANRSMRDAYGRRAPEIVGCRLLELYPDLAGGELFEGYRSVTETGEPFVRPLLGYQPVDGRLRRTSYSISVAKFGDGFISSSRDVTAVEDARAALERSQQQLEAAQRLARIGSWEWNLSTDDRIWSTEFFRLMDIDPSTPVGVREKLALDRIHPDDRTIWRRKLKVALNDRQPFEFEQRLIVPSGVRDTIVQGEIVETERGDVFRGTMRDVTEWRRAEIESFRGRLALDTLQRANLPDLPTMEGFDLGAAYRPAHDRERIGGDWYDAFVLPDGRLALVVGDVSGHGLDAAVSMTHLRNAVRAYALEGAPPHVVLDRLRQFAQLGDFDSFATCLCAIADPRTGAVEYARAGHPPAIVLSSDTSTATTLEKSGGPPIGVAGSTPSASGSLLQHGDLLVLYTDGLVEERRRSIDVGIEELAAALLSSTHLAPSWQAPWIADRLLENRRHVDDACVLIVRRALDGAS